MSPYAESVDKYFDNSNYLKNNVFVNLESKELYEKYQRYFDSNDIHTEFNWTLSYYKNGVKEVDLSENQTVLLNLPNIINLKKSNDAFTNTALVKFNRGKPTFPWP